MESFTNCQESYATRKSRHTLQPTALVNEVWVWLITDRAIGWKDRNHFYAVASIAMRHILVDYGRHRRAHGGDDDRKVALEEAAELPWKRELDLMVLGNALNELAQFDSRKYRIVELKFFGGFDLEEVVQMRTTSSIIRHVKSFLEYLFALLLHSQPRVRSPLLSKV